MKNLKPLSLSVQINASNEKIWDVLWNPKSYGKWTSVFGEGSHYKGELKQGNTIQFLGEDGGGMSSIIQKLIENEQMVFSHQKELKKGVEIDSSWQGAKESYFLKEKDGTTTDLQITMEVTPEMEEYFNNTFPKALALVKNLSEK